jgi:hypothetical protein
VEGVLDRRCNDKFVPCPIVKIGNPYEIILEDGMYLCALFPYKLLQAGGYSSDSAAAC